MVHSNCNRNELPKCACPHTRSINSSKQIISAAFIYSGDLTMTPPRVG